MLGVALRKRALELLNARKLIINGKHEETAGAH